jgi:predicted metal-binding membrane protein
MEGQRFATARTAAAGVAQKRASSVVDGRAAAIATLLVLAGIAWLASGIRMAGMDSGPGSDPGSLGFFSSTWVVMMAAMMLPSIAPALLAHREHQRRASGGRETWASTRFVIGYLAVWGLAGLAGYAVLEAGRSLDGGFLAWDAAGRWAAAGVLVLAGLYELTPYKGACLTRCRTAVAPLGDQRRDGSRALQMGARHGAWCLGCCWALMAALFALGAMSLAWMVVVSLLIAAEKLLPWRAPSVRGVATTLVVAGIAVAAAPAQVPWLTLPGNDTMGMRATGKTGAGDAHMAGHAGTTPHAPPASR